MWSMLGATGAVDPRYVPRAPLVPLRAPERAVDEGPTGDPYLDFAPRVARHARRPGGDAR